MTGSDKLPEMKLIVMLHLCPLEDFASWDTLQRTRYEASLIEDVQIIRDAGVRHLMVENNFDRDLGGSLGSRAASFEHLLDLVSRAVEGTGMGLGVCCRWADWISTFRFMQRFGLAFCRLPLVGLRIETRAGQTLETTYREIEAGAQAFGSNPPVVLCDLMPKNCRIISTVPDLDDRVSRLRSCGATGLIIGERTSGDYLNDVEDAQIDASQGRWRLPAYVAGSVDDVRARSLSDRGVGVIVGGFIYRPATQGSHRRVHQESLRGIVTAVHGR